MPIFMLDNQNRDIALYTCAAEHIAPLLEKHPEQKTSRGCINLTSRKSAKNRIDYIMG